MKLMHNRNPNKPKNRNNVEHEIQCTIAQYLDLKKVLWFATQSGLRTSISQAVKAKKSGFKKGVPDVFIMEPRGEFHGMMVELKAPKGSTKKEQKWWCEMLNDRKYYALVIRAKTIQDTINLVIEEVEGYLAQ